MVDLRSGYPHLVVGRAASLRRSAWRALQGNVGFAASQFGILLILARSQSTSEVGRYALALALCGPVFVLSDLRLRAIQVSRPHDRLKFGDYFANRITMSAVSVLPVGLLALLLDVDAITAEILFAVVLLKFVESLNDVCYGQLEVRELFSTVRNALLIRGLGGLLAFSCVLAVSGRVSLSVGSISVVSLLCLYSTIRRLRILGIALRPRWSRASLIALTLEALPLGVSFFTGILAANLPRYSLGTFADARALGIYAAVAYLPMLSNVVMDAVGQAAAPRLARMMVAGDREAFRRLVLSLSAFGVAVGCVAIVLVASLGERVLGLVFGEDYQSGAPALLILVAGATAQYVTGFMRVGLISSGRYREPLFAALLNLVVVALALALLWEDVSIARAAIAVFAGQVSALVLTVSLLFGPKARSISR